MRYSITRQRPSPITRAALARAALVGSRMQEINGWMFL